MQVAGVGSVGIGVGKRLELLLLLSQLLLLLLLESDCLVVVRFDDRH